MSENILRCFIIPLPSHFFSRTTRRARIEPLIISNSANKLCSAMSDLTSCQRTLRTPVLFDLLLVFCHPPVARLYFLITEEGQKFYLINRFVYKRNSLFRSRNLSSGINYDDKLESSLGGGNIYG